MRCRLLVLTMCFLGSGIAAYAQPVHHYHYEGLPKPKKTKAYPSLPVITHTTTTNYMDHFKAEQKALLPTDLVPYAKDAIFDQTFSPTVPSDMNYVLPRPSKTKHTVKRLSLREAILLALRLNPDVLNSELTRVTDKFALEVAKNQFQPKFTFDLTGTYGNGRRSYGMTTGMTLNNTMGTKVTAGYNNALDGAAGTTTLSVEQPLIKGFGEINKFPLYEAYDTEEVAKLTYKDSVISDVVEVITQYRTLVTDYNNLITEEQNLKTTKDTVRRFKQQVKAGKKAPADLLQQQENLASNQLNVVQQVNSLRNDYQTFLADIGLVPTAKVVIDGHIAYQAIKIPSLHRAIRIALKNNIAYQKALINIREDERSVVTAKDGRKWSLNLTASTQFGDTRTDNILSDADQGPTLKFDLNIPINDVQAKSALIQARISLAQDRLNLQETKQSTIRNVINDWEDVDNQFHQIRIAKLQVKLQKQNFKNSQMQASFGKITQFEVTQQQQDLVNEQINLISTEIGYLNSVTTLYQELGITLDKWNVKLRY